MLSQQLEYSVSVCGMHLELQRREERVFASALVIYNYIYTCKGNEMKISKFVGGLHSKPRKKFVRLRDSQWKLKLKKKL